MELLRIIAMSMILNIHFMIHAIANDSQLESYWRGVTWGIIFTFSNLGVNVFFMLSGWFRVRLSLIGILKLVLIVLIFNVVNMVLCHLSDVPLTLRNILFNLMFPISCEPGYWFIKVYFAMLISSPIINRGLDMMNRSELRMFIFIFTLYQLYSCNLGQNICNPHGYSYIQGLYCYCLAAWLKVDNTWYRNLSQIKCFIAFCAISIVCGLLMTISTYFIYFIKYNGIQNILASALLIIIFSRVKLRSRIINSVSAVSLGCYLLQDGLFGVSYLYPLMHNWWTDNILGIGIMRYFLVFLAIWSLSYVIYLLITPVITRLKISVNQSRFGFSL